MYDYPRPLLHRGGHPARWRRDPAAFGSLAPALAGRGLVLGRSLLTDGRSWDPMGGTPRMKRQVSRESPLPRRVHVPSTPAPQMAARGARPGGADGEGAAWVTSAFRRSREVASAPPPPAPAPVRSLRGGAASAAGPKTKLGAPRRRPPRPAPSRRGALPAAPHARGGTGEGARRGPRPERSSGRWR